MKRIVVSLVSLVVIFAFSACGGGSSEKVTGIATDVIVGEWITDGGGVHLEVKGDGTVISKFSEDMKYSGKWSATDSTMEVFTDPMKIVESTKDKLVLKDSQSTNIYTRVKK